MVVASQMSQRLSGKRLIPTLVLAEEHGGGWWAGIDNWRSVDRGFAAKPVSYVQAVTPNS
jgi:hypothetical protein